MNKEEKNNIGRRGSNRHSNNHNRRRTNSRRLSEDERIRRENDKKRELDAKIRKQNDRKRELDQKLRSLKRKDSYGSMGDNENEYVGQEIVDNIKDKFNNIKDRIFNNHKESLNNGTSSSNNHRVTKNFKFNKKKVFKGIGIFLLLILFINIFSIVRFFLSIKNTVGTEAVSPGFFKPVNILVLGMDIGAVGQENNQSIKRTDTIMVVNYNPKTKATKVVSIPRDTLITENGSNFKINAAYVKGQDKKVKEVVENLLGITVNYTIKVSYEAFRSVIDSIGGVNMEIAQDMIYDDDGQNLHINFKGGTTVHLDGKKAEEFFRWRKNNDGTGLATGDIGRIENQHKFIQKVVKKCANPLILFRMPKILSAVGSNIETNMGAFSIIGYAFKFAIHKSKMEIVTLEGTPKMIKGQSYLVLDDAKNKTLIDSLKNGASSKASSGTNKSSQRILVLNGTSTNGLASKVKEKLKSSGYSNVETGNTSETKKTVIKTDNKEIKNSISDVINKSKSSSLPDEYSGYDAVIILGSDYTN